MGSNVDVALANSVGLIIVLLLIVISAILVYYNGRQATALEKRLNVAEKEYAFTVRRHREKKDIEVLPGGALGWLNIQATKAFGLDMKFSDQSVGLKSFPVYIQYSEDLGNVLIASPFTTTDLKKKLKSLEKANGALGGFDQEGLVQLLLKREVMASSRSLANAGDFFDLEIAKAGSELKMDWNNLDTLHLIYSKA